MNFWQVFYEESLHSPWVIKPEGMVSASAPKIENSKVFVVEPSPGDAAYTMLSKMVLALNYKNSEVTILEAQDAEELSQLDGQHRIMFFGEIFPGEFGETINWYGQQVTRTHSLNRLLEKPELKRETWAHLKKYGSVK